MGVTCILYHLMFMHDSQGGKAHDQPTPEGCNLCLEGSNKSQITVQYAICDLLEIMDFQGHLVLSYV